MIAAILDHLWQSTLLAAVVSFLVVAFRNARASVRFGLWFVASVKFLVPFAAFAAVGRLLAPAIRPPAEAGPDAVFVALAAQPFSQADLAAPPTHLPDPALVLAGVWALGCAVVLIFWMSRWAKIRRLVRQAAPAPLAAPMPALVSATLLEPGLVGVWRPILLVPKALFDHLDQPQLDALVAHEACHYRRADNLTAAIHMLVEAVFWFHPMVWWIGGRLVAERERACDEAVVRSGHDRAAYAESLLACCRLFLRSSLPCAVGASGSDLPRRVAMILNLPLRGPLSRSGRAVLAAAGACALASPVAAGWLTTPAIRQTVTEVATIASSPARVLMHEPPAARPAPGRQDRAQTAAPARSDAPSVLPVQRIAALPSAPMQLEPGDDHPPPPRLAEPGLPATTAAIPDARLTPAAEVQPLATPPRGRQQVWLTCKTVRVLQPSPYVTHLCQAQSDWDKTQAQANGPPSSANE